ncbi:hypothetical protein [Roseovarius salis]|uniref:hypothetical protein n=1 Tax=Roseovarius salis TaxID=3376063 RepID=UPI0037CA545F
MRASLAISVLFLVFLSAPFRGHAAELLMVRQAGCSWCAQWEADIGHAYAKTQEAERAPLRRVEIGALPDDISFASQPVFTPTFVLVDDGQELGRIEGYPGAHFFWPLLVQLLDAHPDATRPGS